MLSALDKLEEKKNDVVKLEAKCEMTSLSQILSSGLNTEMVYTILHGLCKFSLLNYMKNALSKQQLKEFRAMEYRVDQHGDTTITLREVMISDPEMWEKQKVEHNSFTSKSTFKSTDRSTQNQ